MTNTRPDPVTTPGETRHAPACRSLVQPPPNNSCDCYPPYDRTGPAIVNKGEPVNEPGEARRLAEQMAAPCDHADEHEGVSYRRACVSCIASALQAARQEAEGERDHWHITADAHAKFILRAQELSGIAEDADTIVERLLARLREKDEEIAQIKKQAELWESDARNFKACWDAACNDVGERDEEIARLKAEAAMLAVHHQTTLEAAEERCKAARRDALEEAGKAVEQAIRHLLALSEPSQPKEAE